MSDIGRALLIVFAVLLFPAKSYANYGYNGFCQDGGVSALIQGISSTNFLQGSFPGCTVTVNIHGGGLATIFSDNLGTAKSNPFTASSTDGSFLFYAANGRYDINVAATGLNYTYTDVIFLDSVGLAITNPIFTAGVRSDAYIRSTDGDRQISFDNPDFEFTSLIPTPGWFLTANATFAYETVTQDPNKLQSAKITTTAAGAGIEVGTSSNPGQIQRFSVFPGETYSLKFDAKSDGTAIVDCNIFFRNNAGGFPGPFISATTQSTSWVTLTASGTVPATAINASVSCQNDSGATSTFWVDRLSVQKSSFPAGLTSPAFVNTTNGDRQAILQNPDFEGTTVIPPPGWTPRGVETLSYETSTQLPGKNQSLKVVCTASSGGVGSTTQFSVNSGETYSINAEAKTDGVAQAIVAIVWRDKNGVAVGANTQQVTTLTTWTGLFANGSVPSNAIRAQVVLECGAATGTVWFDQVSIQKLSVPGTFATGAFAPTRGDRQVILPNPDFEVSTQILPPPGWFRNHNTETVTYETSTQAPNKKQSIKIATVDVNGGIVGIPFYSVVPGDTYTISGLAKSDGTGTASIILNWYDKTGNNISGNAISTQSTAWTTLVTTGIVPATADSLNISVLNTGVTQPSTVWFDLISVQKANFPDRIIAPAVIPFRGDRQPILANPDFSASTSILPPPGWQLGGTGTNGNVTLSYETSTPAPGKAQSLKMVAGSPNPNGISQLTIWPVVPGDTYAITGLAKSDGTGSATIIFDIRDKNGTELAFSVASTTSTSWVTLVGGLVTVPANAVNAFVAVYNNVANSTVWFDEISVQKLNFPGPVSSNTGFQINGTAPNNHIVLGNGTAYVDNTFPLAIIPPGTNGQCLITSAGVAAWGTCAGLVAPQINTTTVSVTGAVNTPQNLQSVTFPAGVFNALGKAVDIQVVGSFTPVNNTELINVAVSPIGNGLEVNVVPSNTGAWSWKYHAICTVLTAGASGVMTCGGEGLTGSTNATIGNTWVQPGTNGTLTMNLTAAVTFQATIQFGTASASNFGQSIFMIATPLN